MPVLLVVGEDDDWCPPMHQKIFFDALPKNTNNELHIIKGAQHTFRSREHLEQLKTIFDTWLKKINQ